MEIIENAIARILAGIFFLKMADKADKFEALEQQLELFIENTRQLGIIVSDFQPQGQNVLNQKL